MKKLYFTLLIGIAIMIFSCQEQKPTQQEIVRQNVEEYLKLKMDDPNSYEFVELRLLKDSVLYSDNIKYRRDEFKRQVEPYKTLLESEEIYKNLSSTLYNEERANEYRKDIERNELILTKIDSLESLLGTKVNDVASYTYYFSYRGNNKMGAKVLNETILQTQPAPDFKIINLAKEKKEVYLNPNDFPGYRDMIKKMYDK